MVVSMEKNISFIQVKEHRQYKDCRELPLSTMTQYWGDRYNQHAKRLEEKLGIEIPKVELSELKRFREEIPISEDW